jgi:mRNA interferase MazF
MKRGDIILAALPGDYGKPRPTIVVQSDRYNETHASVVICPCTTHLIGDVEYRIRIMPTTFNGLKQESDIMIDKISALRHIKLQDVLGKLTSTEMQRVDAALKIWLSLS